LSKTRKPLNVIHGNARFTKFNKDRGDPIAGLRPRLFRVGDLLALM